MEKPVRKENWTRCSLLSNGPIPVYPALMDPKRYDIANRAAEKQASRDEDAARLARGEITGAELRVENNFFASLDMTRFKIVAIGGRPIKFNKNTTE